jgi:hypothetical protein
MGMAVRRKCFISYHHDDQLEVNEFIRTFDHNHDVFISRGLGSEMTDEIINSTDTDYVMRRIRQRFLADSTVTLVMMGRCTWARRYVDWEIQSSLRRGQSVTPNGLLGIKLPSFPQGGTFPERLNANLASPDDERRGMPVRYARVIDYPRSLDSLVNQIEVVFSRRLTHSQNIVNRRERFGYNRTCN